MARIVLPEELSKAESIQQMIEWKSKILVRSEKNEVTEIGSSDVGRGRGTSEAQADIRHQKVDLPHNMHQQLAMPRRTIAPARRCRKRDCVPFLSDVIRSSGRIDRCAVVCCCLL